MPPSIGSDPSSDRFAEAVRRICLQLAGTGDASARDLALVETRLERVVSRKFPTLRSLVGDIVGDALLRFTVVAKKQGVHCEENPGAYLLAIALNAAKDELARQLVPLEPLSFPQPVEGPDELVINRVFGDEQVKKAMAAAQGAGDSVAVKVLVAYLDLSEQLGDSPSNRQVAVEADTSHVTVGRVLMQAGAYLSESLEEWPSRTGERSRK